LADAEPGAAGIVDAVMAGRHAVRAFLPTPVPRASVEAILAVARRAPSGTNLQPWRVHVLTGAARQRLVDAVCAAYDADEPGPPRLNTTTTRPSSSSPTWRGGARSAGGCTACSASKRVTCRECARNCGATTSSSARPSGLIFSIDRRMGRGGWLDYGMFLQNVMLAAKARGLDTCPQVAWLDYHRIIAAELGFTEQEMLVCGMCLGHADPDAPENRLATERAALGDFVVFHE
jgi:nitroreductase